MAERLARPTSRQAARSRRIDRRFRLMATEWLEDRALLATIIWNGAGDGTTFTSGANWRFGVAPTATDDASISNLAANAVITLPASGYTVKSLTQTGGTIQLTGGTFTTTAGFDLNSSTFNFTGGTLAGPTNLGDSTLNVAPAATFSTLTVTGISTFSGTIGANETVAVQGNSTDRTATMTVAQGSSNLGTILLQSASGSSFVSGLVAGGSSWTNTGTIQVNPSVSPSTISGNFINAGTLNVAATATLAYAGLAGQSFVQSAGTLAVAGSLQGTGGVLQLDAGVSVTGSGVVSVQGGAIKIGSGIANPLTVIAFGTGNTLVGNDSSKGTIWVQGNGSGRNASLTIAQGASNLGTIQLQSANGSGFTSDLAVAPGSTFTNAGTVLVNASTNDSTLSGNFANNGTFTVSGGATLNVSNPAGQGFLQAGGTLAAPGTFNVTGGGLFQVDGGTVSGTVVALNASLRMGSTIANPTTVLVRASNPGAVLLSNDSPKATVWVQGANNPGSATLTVAPGAANLGTILLQSASGSFQSSNLAAASGSTFTNAGTIQVNTSGAASNLSGNVINTGTINVAGGATLNVNNPVGQSFVQAGGTLSAAGTFLASGGGLVQVDGGNVSGTVAVQNVSLKMGSTIANPTTVFVYNSNAGTTLISNDSSKATVWVQGNGNYGAATLTLAPGAANLGTLRLESASGSGFTSNLAVAGGSSFTNAGTILVNPSSNPSTLSGNVINAGTVTVSGAATLRVNNTTGQSFVQAAGTLSAAGTFLNTGGMFEVDGGTVTGTVAAQGGTLYLTPTITATTNIFVYGSNVDTVLVSNDSPRATVWVQGNVNYGASTLTLAPGAANLGTLRLESASGSGFTSNLAVAGGSDFTNTGIVQVNASSNASTLSGNFINKGTVNVAGGAVLSITNAAGQSFVQSSGTIAAAGTFLNTGGLLQVDGGTLTGTVATRSGSLKMGASIAVATTVYAFNSATPTILMGNDSPLATVWVQGNSSYGAAVLTIAAGAANLGTLRLESASGSTFTNSLGIASGSIFTNTGTIQVNPGGNSTIAGDLINNGTINLAAATLTVTGTTLNNSPSGVISASGTLNVSATTFLNEGTLNIGVGNVAAKLTLTGAFTQLPTGKLNVQIGGVTAGTLHDQIAISGAANLSGTLNASLINGFSPVSGNNFTVMTYGSVSGAFANYGGLQLPSGLGLSPNRLAASFRLDTVVRPQADLAVTMTADRNPVAVGNNLVYTILVRNNGPQQATGVILTDVLPAGVTFVAAIPTQGTASLSNGVVTASLGNMASGSTATLNVTVTPTAIATLTNGVSVVSTGPIDLDPNANNNAASLVVDAVAAQAALALSMTANPDPVLAGNALTYVLTLKNTGPLDALGASIVDTLPAGFNVTSITPSQGTASQGGNTVTASLGTLANNATATLTIIGTMPAAGSITNSAVASSTVTDLDATNNSASKTTTVTAPQADLGVTITATPSPVLVGANVTYTVRVTNAGPQAATGVVLTDNLPAGLTVVSITPSQGTTSRVGDTVTASLGNIASGGSATLTVVVTTASVGTLAHTASVASGTGDPTPGNNNASRDVNVVAAQADLNVSMSASPSTVLLGGNVTYTLTVGNAGPQAATGVVLTDVLPGGVAVASIVASQGTTSQSGGTITVSLGTLASGASATITIVVTPSAAATITNSAGVTSDVADPTPANNTASKDVTVVTPQSDLSVTVVASPNPVTVGDNLTFTVKVTNSGPQAASGVVLTDSLPVGASIVSIATTQGTYAVNGGVITAALGSLANGATATLTIVVSVSGPGTVSSTATVTGDQSDPAGGNNSATATANAVKPVSDLSTVVKVTAPTPIYIGQTVVYNITVGNAGPRGAGGITVVDVLPSTVTFVSINLSQGTYVLSGNTLTISLGTLNNAGSANIQISVIVNAAGSIANSATTTSSTSDDNNPGNDTGTITTVVVPPPGSFQFTAIASIVSEAAGTASILVQRVNGSGGAVSVRYATANGTATAGADYSAQSGILTFADGQTSATINVPIVLTPSLVPTKSFTLALSAPTGGATLGSPASQVVTILDSPGTLQLATAGAFVNRVAGTVTLTVNRTIGAGGNVSVQYATIDGSGKAGLDFTAQSGTLTFADNQVTRTVTIPILKNPGAVGLRTFSLALASPAGGASLGALTATTVSVSSEDLRQNDFDGDGKSDFGVFQPSTSTFYFNQTSAGNKAVPFGQGINAGGGPIHFTGDFDGDGKSDFGVFQPLTSTFYFNQSAAGTKAIPFGQGRNAGGNPLPIAGDFDGDGKSDFGVFQPSTSTFFFNQSSAGTRAVAFGQGINAGGDPIPFAGDFDGDGKSDFGVFQPSTSTFYFNQTSAGNRAVPFGQGAAAGGNPVPFTGDFDGDGKFDFGVFQPVTSTFYFNQSSAGTKAVTFGQGTRAGGNPVPITGDYDGDGRFDFAVFQPSTSTFAFNQTTAGVKTVAFGQGINAGGNPIPLGAPLPRTAGSAGGTGGSAASHLRSASISNATAAASVSLAPPTASTQRARINQAHPRPAATLTRRATAPRPAVARALEALRLSPERP